MPTQLFARVLLGGCYGCCSSCGLVCMAFQPKLKSIPKSSLWTDDQLCSVATGNHNHGN
ncbi:hypothetical protein PGIGA_G00164280, partial [Pangasianodon gigas]|nr:hypothetical protein [Pangasianodon gigas]